MPRIFLTGGSGFIGSHLARKALAAGHEVAVLVRPGESLWRIEDLAEKLVVFRGNLEDAKSFREELVKYKPQVCVHLAWYTQPSGYVQHLRNVSCLVQSLKLLEELSRSRCERVVMVGTCAEYAVTSDMAQEDGPTWPDTLYGACKLALSHVARELAATMGIGFAWGRVFYLYGPFEDSRRAVPTLIKTLAEGMPFAATNGQQVRDYLHVEDVAKALLMLAETHAQGVFNICSAKPITMRRLMENIGSIMGCKELIRFGQLSASGWNPPFICGDNRRLLGLGWRPEYTLECGLTQTVRWWQSRFSRVVTLPLAVP